MPEIKIDEARCKGCTLCVAACPKKCIEMSTTFSTTGYYPAKFKSNGCTGCALCFQICPELAIEVWK